MMRCRPKADTKDGGSNHETWVRRFTRETRNILVIGACARCSKQVRYGGDVSNGMGEKVLRVGYVVDDDDDDDDDDDGRQGR